MAAVTGTASFTLSGLAVASSGYETTSWTKRFKNGVGEFTASFTGPNNTSVYSPVIDFLGNYVFDPIVIGIYASLSAAAATNCTVNLRGGPTKEVEASIAITSNIFTGDIGTTPKYVSLAFSDDPYPYYFLEIVSTGDNDDKTVSLTIWAPLEWTALAGVQG